MKRSIKIIGNDKELILSKVVAINTNLEMIHLDKLKDGTWRLIYNTNTIDDITKIESLKIIREND